MKTLLFSLTVLMLAKTTIAQKELLSLDEHNQYIFYQVVDMPGQGADTLNLRGLNFLKSVIPKIKITPGIKANEISGEGKFSTTGGISILKHPNGEISYKISVECKDQKYRYWLTNFIFTPYVRDRYGNFVPQQGVEIPLKTASSKLNKTDLDNYLNQTGAFSKDMGERLKLYMVNAPAPKKAEITKKTVTEKW